MRLSKKKAGFTLLEVLIATTLMGFVMLGVLTSFVFIARSYASIGNYSEMNGRGRNFLERFGRDVRQATAVSGTSSSGVTLTVPSDDSTVSSESVVYAY